MTAWLTASDLIDELRQQREGRAAAAPPCPCPSIDARTAPAGQAAGHKVVLALRLTGWIAELASWRKERIID